MRSDDQINWQRRNIAALTIGAGLVLSLPVSGASRDAKGATAIPDSLEPWVAKEGQNPTVVLNPCYIDDVAAEELSFYHPISVDSTRYSFKHVAAQDDRGRPYARVESISDNWNEKMVEVLLALRFYPERIGGVDVLVDRAIKDVDTRAMHGWKVTEWLVVKNRNADLEVVHQDFVTWKKDGLVAKSMFSWRNYD